MNTAAPQLDPLMVPLVKKLNTLGLVTRYSCQGNHDESDKPRIAYITFAPGVVLPHSVKEAISERDWQLDHQDEDTYSVYAVPSDFSYDALGLRNRNEGFIKGWWEIIYRSF